MPCALLNYTILCLLLIAFFTFPETHFALIPHLSVYVCLCICFHVWRKMCAGGREGQRWTEVFLSCFSMLLFPLRPNLSLISILSVSACQDWSYRYVLPPWTIEWVLVMGTDVLTRYSKQFILKDSSAGTYSVINITVHLGIVFLPAFFMQYNWIHYFSSPALSRSFLPILSQSTSCYYPLKKHWN